MKKSLLALAALSAFAGAASAQSSVTLSGGVDMAIQRVDDAYQMSTGNSARSNLTFSGNEDLGGGMRAFFSLNYRFNPGDGKGTSQPTDGRFWRQSWVGLGGAFGQIRLGRMLPVLQTFNGDFDPFGTETIGSVHTGGLTSEVPTGSISGAGLAGGSRNNNTVYYTSPAFGGFSVHANISAADNNANAAGTTSGPERPIGLGANFAMGPFRIAAAMDKNTYDQQTVGVYGSYNFGFATLMAQYETGDRGTTTNPEATEVTRWSIGARAPIGAATLKVGYTDWSDENKSRFGAGLDYNLSKRTIVYADVGKASGTGYTDVKKKAQFDVGVWHKF